MAVNTATDVKTVISKKLVFLREREHWTQGDLSRRSGVSVQTIVFLENGITPVQDISIYVLIQLANAFSSPIAIFFVDYEQHYNEFGMSV